MVNDGGQGITEYIVMMAILTLIGLWIMNGVGTGKGLTNLKGNSGSIPTMSNNATDKIKADEHP